MGVRNRTARGAKPVIAEAAQHPFVLHPVNDNSAPEPQYTYKAYITHIYDADTWIIDIDLGMSTHKVKETIRLYGVNAREIKRSSAKRIGARHVANGFADRNHMLRLLGLDPRDFRRIARYTELSKPIPVTVATIKDKGGKFGRLLAIVYDKNGVNLNEALRDRLGAVDFYDGKTYPADTAIRPPQGFFVKAAYLPKDIPDEKQAE